MNIFSALTQNPVVMYGLVGSIAGAMMGGSKKKRTQAAITYGTVGAAAGFFIDKSNQKKQQASVGKAIAITAAKRAVEEAAQADVAGFAGHRPGHPRPPKGSRAYHMARKKMKAYREQQNQQQNYAEVGMMAVPGVF